MTDGRPTEKRINWRFTPIEVLRKEMTVVTKMLRDGEHWQENNGNLSQISPSAEKSR